MNIHLTLLACYGIAWVIGSSKITFYPRLVLAAKGGVGHVVLSLLECVGCIGFWIGLAAGLSILHLPVVEAIGFGFAVTGSNIVLEAIANGRSSTV